MDGTASEEFGVGRSLEEISTGQQRNDALVEWRSCEQLEIGIPSTSPPYWDSDDEDDNGPKPCELYGKYTWKIDKFSQINKRELRSSPFEVGGYKWYILIYPQGCDVCNHLSLFLCVANHDKLLPGWSHFAQFTIAVVNKDPKKSKYSDTLHRFWKKEHDWGWKKFMELSKVLDGFIDADTLIIKAQVQVIRERADRPFRCLDCNYRRELIRVYLTNVEQICRRFVEERRGKLGKLIEDKGRWASFCTFWLGMDLSVRRAMCWEKTDSILKVIAKNFFIEKEVTSTLVMDSLYSGMKALESRYAKSKGKHGDIVEPPAPIVRMEKDMFILVDDVLVLLERATLEPLPPKDEKGPQNRTKDGSSGDEFNKDSIERDERRLTELGRRTIEIFVLAHIFTKIEVAYQEAVALKRQEELIREEEAAESEQKTKRGAGDKEKKSKKKQGKQKRNNRKTKDKIKDEKPVIVPIEHHHSLNNVTEDVSDVSDSVDCIPEVGDQIPAAVNWDSGGTQDLQLLVEGSSCEISTLNGPAGEMSAVSVIDDSSSTCSTDSISSLVNGINKGKFSSYYTKRYSPNRRHERGKSMEADWSGGYYNQSSESAVGNQNDISKSCKRTDINSQAHNQTNGINQPEFNKVEEMASSRTILGIKVEQEAERLSLEVTLTLPTQPVVPTKNSTTSERKISSGKVRLSDSKKPADESSEVHVIKPTTTSTGSDSPEKKPSALTQHVSVSVVKPVSTNQVPVFPEKLSTVTRPTVVSRPLSSSSRLMVHTAPILSRSSSSTGWSNPEPSSTATSSYSYVPQSYRNVMMGNNSALNVNSASFVQPPHPSSPRLQSAHPIKSSFSPFGRMKQDTMPVAGDLIDTPPQTEGGDDMYNHQMQHSRPNYLVSSEYAGTSGRVNNGLADEFPHMGIINDLLEDDAIGKAGVTNSSFHTFNNGGQHFHRQFSLPNATDIGLPTSTSSCRFERTLSYHDGLHRYAYASPYETLPPQPSYRPYAANGHHMDMLLPNQWHMGGGGSPYLSTRDMNNDGYTSYHHNHGEYMNMGINYSGFHPSNGNGNGNGN